MDYRYHFSNDWLKHFKTAMNMDLKNKIVSVIGLGKTGVATANFLARRGSKVSIMDNKPYNQLSELTDQLLPGIETVYQN